VLRRAMAGARPRGCSGPAACKRLRQVGGGIAIENVRMCAQRMRHRVKLAAESGSSEVSDRLFPRLRYAAGRIVVEERGSATAAVRTSWHSNADFGLGVEWWIGWFCQSAQRV
jgi:hypothetical protein